MKKNVWKSRDNHIKLMRLFSMMIVLIIIAPEVVNAQTGKTDFSGTWAFNETKSNLGDRGGRFGGGDLMVKQDANVLTVERKFTNRDGETNTRSSKYNLDGKESVNSSGRGESKSTAKWALDGKSLTIITKRSFNGNERTSTEIWTLKDAKTLSVESTIPGRDGGERKTTRVYDKK